MIPISVVKMDKEIEEEVLKVLRSGTIAQGPKVAELEALFARISGVKHAVAVNNGTTALVATLKQLDVPDGATVVTTPFTFVATLNAAVESGLRVRFVDVDPRSFNMSPAALDAADKTDVEAVMPVHLYGQCADMTSITEIAGRHGWKVVEDAAQAHGASHKGKPAGSFGVGCFSFYATKNITTGEGGIITTDDDSLAERLRVYRNQGMRVRYQYEMAGTNYRMTDVQAAIGIPQLKRINEIINRRQLNAKVLNELLRGVDEILTPTIDADNVHVWHQYTIRVLQGGRRSRDEVMDRITAAGVGCGIYYPRLAFDYDCFVNHPMIEVSDTPIARNLAREVISLPVHQYLSEADLHQIADAVRIAVR